MQNEPICNYCGQSAQLMCGKCQNVFYCKSDHQRLDWKRHGAICKSYQQIKQQQLKRIYARKFQIFELIAKYPIDQAILASHQCIIDQKEFMSKKGNLDFQLQLELGGITALYIRLLIVSKNLSEAQQTFQEYFKEKISFLNNTDNIMSYAQLDNLDQKQRKIQHYYLSGKLHLLSSLVNITHELIRNSVDMLEIIINHMEKVYGSDSLQLSNVFFYTANYLNFLQQPQKALACFLKCGKIRKQKGGVAYYNVALLLRKKQKLQTSLHYFQKALDLIVKQNNKEQAHVIPQIYENMAIIDYKLGMTKKMMDNFEKAYFYYKKLQDQQKADNIMDLFLYIRKQSKEENAEEIKVLQFPKQRKTRKPGTTISSKNYQKFRYADRPAQQDDTKYLDWINSFKDNSKLLNQPSSVKYPVKELEYLFGNNMNKKGQEEIPAYLQDNIQMVNSNQGVNMDLEYITHLNSNQVQFLHLLNRQLMQCKERAAIYDIVENSNFYQAICKQNQKLYYFQRLNPQLVRPSDYNRRDIILDRVQEQHDDDDFQYNAVQTARPITPKLDLSKLNNFKK